MGAGGDIKKDHFVGPLFVVAEGQIDRVPYVAQFTGFGLAELDTAGDLAVMHVQAGNDAFGEHRLVSTDIYGLDFRQTSNIKRSNLLQPEWVAYCS